jgi:hypothetical protein
MVEFVAAGTQADFNVSQTFPKSDLRESHTQELIPTCELTDLVVPAITGYAAPELFRVDPFGELSQNSFSGVHASSLASTIQKKTRR